MRYIRRSKGGVPSSTRAAARKLQKEGTCQAFTIAAFTSSCPSNLGSLCLGPPRHRCQQPSHGVESCTFFFSNFYMHLVALSRMSLQSFPSSCRREILATLEAGNCAGSRAFVLYDHLSRGIYAARSHDLVVLHAFTALSCGFRQVDVKLD